MPDQGQEPPDRRAALAALDGGGIEIDLATEWREQRSQLSESEILRRAQEIGLFLQQIPTPRRSPFFDEVAKHCTFSLTGYSRRPSNAIMYLSRAAQGNWVRQWARGLGDVSSVTSRNELRAAFAKRMSELGEFDAAFDFVKEIGDRRLRAEALTVLLVQIPIDRIEPIFEYGVGITFDHAESVGVWSAMSQRWRSMAKSQSFALAAVWLRQCSREPVRKVLLGIGGGAVLIDSLGGESALASVLDWIHGPGLSR